MRRNHSLWAVALTAVTATLMLPAVVHAASPPAITVSGGGTAELLEELYASERDSEVKEEILHAFFIQGNTKTLIRIARSETNRELKLEAVQHLSRMGSRDATEFLMEMLEETDDE